MVILTSKGGIPQGNGFLDNYHNFSHWISYLVSPYYYLNGHGMGSSYLAENYLAMGFFGVILVSAVIGLMLYLISNFSFSNNLFLIGFYFIIAQTLFTIARSETFYWFGDFTYYVFVSILVYPVYRHYRRHNERKIQETV